MTIIDAPIYIGTFVIVLPMALTIWYLGFSK